MGREQALTGDVDGKRASSHWGCGWEESKLSLGMWIGREQALTDWGCGW